MKLSKKKVIRTDLGIYHRALETDDFIYYVNFKEGDENGSTRMFNRKMELVSDNYFASNSLLEDLLDETYTWISNEMKANLREIKKEYSK